MAYIAPSHRGTCAACGKPVQISPTSAAVQRCRACQHSYRRGCRCQECRDAQAARMRAYLGRKRTEGALPDYRKREPRACEQCGSEFAARLDNPGRFCSMVCANSFQGFSSRPPRGDRFRISATRRRAIYERDGWVCKICDEPIDRSAAFTDDWSPTLDHVTPRSAGGCDDDDNLRLAHRWCNSVRGNLANYTDADLQGVA